MKNLLIIGSGALGQQIAHWAISDRQYNVVGFVDDYAEINSLVQNIPVVGKIDDTDNLFSQNFFDELLVGIGYNHFEFRKAVFLRFFGKIPFAKLIHSSCFVDSTAKIGEGCVIYPGCVVDAGVTIKENVLINVSSTIGHECEIGPHSFVAAKALIGGCTIVGEKCMIGNGVTTLGHLKIVDNCIVGCGAVLLKSIKKVGVYLGNPAKYYSDTFE